MVGLSMVEATGRAAPKLSIGPADPYQPTIKESLIVRLFASVICEAVSGWQL
jgi:hypothetical protein